MKNNCNFANSKSNTTAGPLMKALFDLFENGMNGVSESLKEDNTTFKFPPLLNILKKDGAYTLEFLIPGANKEDIKISYDEKILTISYTNQDEDKDYMKKEFGHKNYERKMKIRPSMDLANMNAEYTNGILHMHIPEKEATENKVTEVNVN